LSFFDKQQDVIDIKLTQFGKNLLARGAFKPVFYRFFDDGVLYNIEKAGTTEAQKKTQERIQEGPYLKTQHLVVPLETRFDAQQNLINSGEIKTFMEIKRRQDPLLADKILMYPLQDSAVNSQEAPSITVTARDTEISSSADVLESNGISLPVPQLNFSSSYTLVENRALQDENVPSEEELIEREVYLDLVSDKVDFLDRSFIEMIEENVVLEIEESHVNPSKKNFEIEIFEIDDHNNFIRLESQIEIENYFTIEVDEEFTDIGDNTRRHERFQRERPQKP
tara:strand:- start:294 stop:1136 length:843 start_codon:yes stop_codon:yes gene_type:complete